MIGKWVKNSEGKFEFLQFTEEEVLKHASDLSELNRKVFEQCYKKAGEIAVNLKLKDDEMETNVLEITLALFDKSSLQLFSILQSELSKPQ